MLASFRSARDFEEMRQAVLEELMPDGAIETASSIRTSSTIEVAAGAQSEKKAKASRPQPEVCIWLHFCMQAAQSGLCLSTRP